MLVNNIDNTVNTSTFCWRKNF